MPVIEDQEQATALPSGILLALLLALRGINLNPGDEPEDRVSLRIWTDGRRVISSRRRSLRSTEIILEELRDGSAASAGARHPKGSHGSINRKPTRVS